MPLSLPGFECKSGEINAAVVTYTLWFFFAYITVLLVFSALWVAVRRSSQHAHEPTPIEIELIASKFSDTSEESSEPSSGLRHRSAARFTMVGHATGDDNHAFQQRGYSQRAMGLWVRRGWVFLLIAMQLALVVFTYRFYTTYAEKFTRARDGECFFMPFAYLYYPSLIFFLVLAKLPFVEHWFLAQCVLEDATHVAISEIGSDMRGSDNMSIVPVHDGSERWFVHMCTTYVWKDQRFRPTGLANFYADSVPRNGLSQEVAGRLLEWCKNSVDVEVPSFLSALIKEFSGGFYKYQLCGVWMLTWYAAQQEGILMGNIAVLSGFMNALVTRRLHLQVRDLVRNRENVHALRSDTWRSISASELVPGDAFRPAVGNVPCDCILLEGGAVVNESMLTGDFIPVPKFALEKAPVKVDSSTHRRHYLFAGTEIVHVTKDALCIASATGAATVSGRMIRNVLFPTPVKFALHRQLFNVYLLMMLYGFICFLIYSFRKTEFIASLFSGTLLFYQALNPLFPVSLKAGEFMSAQRLKKAGIRCLSPSRIPMAGSLHVMVFDKTGTLTTQAMVFSGVCSADSDSMSMFADPSDLMLLGMGTCHTIKRIDGELVGPSIDLSMLDASGWTFETDHCLCNGQKMARVLRVLEFSHEWMTSGALVRTGDRNILFIKGSYERCATMCTVAPKFLSTASQLARDAYYVLGIAYREVPEDEVETLLEAPRASLEESLNILGLLLFENRLKDDSLQVITELERGGVRSIMCTGDNMYTSIAIARKCGIINGRLWVASVVDGKVRWEDDVRKQEIRDMRGELRKGIELAIDGFVLSKLRSSGDMQSLMPYIRVCAGMTPEQKVAVVEIIRSMNLVVGMCGDGGNDCAALRAAHVGIALSGAEASIVAPFSAGNKQCSSVVTVIKIGRASLETNLALCSFFLGSGLVITFSKLMLFFLDGVAFTEYQLLLMNVILPAFLTWGMASCCHSSKDTLAHYPLSSSPFSHGPVFAVLATYGWWFVTFFVIRRLLFNQLWFYYLAPSSSHESKLQYLTDIFGGSNALFYLGDNYLSSTMYILLIAQLMSMALGMSVGGDHRKSAFRSWRLIFINLLLLFFWWYVLFFDETWLSCTLRINCSNNASRTSSWFLTDLSATRPLGSCFFGPQFQIALRLGGWWGCEAPDVASCYGGHKSFTGCGDKDPATCKREAEAERPTVLIEGYRMTPKPGMCPESHPWAYGALLFSNCCASPFGAKGQIVNNRTRLKRTLGCYKNESHPCQSAPCYDFRPKGIAPCIPPQELKIDTQRAMRVDDEVVGPNNIFPLTWKLAIFVIAAVQSSSLLCFFSLLPALLRKVGKKEKGLADLAAEQEDWNHLPF